MTLIAGISWDIFPLTGCIRDPAKSRGTKVERCEKHLYISQRLFHPYMGFQPIFISTNNNTKWLWGNVATFVDQKASFWDDHIQSTVSPCWVWIEYCFSWKTKHMSKEMRHKEIKYLKIKSFFVFRLKVSKVWVENVGRGWQKSSTVAAMMVASNPDPVSQLEIQCYAKKRGSPTVGLETGLGWMGPTRLLGQNTVHQT